LAKEGSKMYQKILVPLDGSELSECSLEHVRAIATGCQVPEVVLLRAVEPASTQAIAAYADAGIDVAKVEGQAQLDASNYLSQSAGKLKKEGVAAQTALVRGKPADVIVDYAKKNGVDLIIMSTHGRSGISRWVLGSVADRVVRSSAIPVLIITPRGCRIDVA